MKLRNLRPFPVAAPVAALAASIAATPAEAAAGCTQAAHAYATQEISLIDPLKTLQGCIKERLDKAKDKNVAKPEKINWQNCRAIAARYSHEPDAVTTRQFVELGACVDRTIKDFHK